MPGAVVVFAVGNSSRGDDALGPLLLERLAAWLDAEGRRGEFELIDDFQLQIEHAFDLAGQRLALFIDAGAGTPAPCVFHAVSPGTTLATHSTHALSPAAVLAVYREFAHNEPPPAFVLCVRGEGFGLGDGLSAAAHEHLDAAWQVLRCLCRTPEVAAWTAAATEFPAQVARAPAGATSAAQGARDGRATCVATGEAAT